MRKNTVVKTCELKCSFCAIEACKTEDEKKPPKFCPMPFSEELIKQVLNMYTENEDVRRLALESARIEAEGYCQWTRIEETINFAKRLGILLDIVVLDVCDKFHRI